MEKMTICQSCAMPLNSPEDYGSEKDGSKSADYCLYCYVNGEFTSNNTMEEMIEACLSFALEGKVYPDAETARKQMFKDFPRLKRWAPAQETA